MLDVSNTIKPKSDQLNADDLIAGALTVTVQNVTVQENSDQPVLIHIGNGHQPYKPCKSMRRLLVSAWGKFANEWVGRSMTLFNDQSVKWAGKEVGGIRISHLSNISGSININLTTTRGQRKPYTVKELKVAEYPQQDFDKNKSAWAQAVIDGKTTLQDLSAKVSQKGVLTGAQFAELEQLTNPQQSDDLPEM